MTKNDLETLNAELIALLTNLSDQINETLEELGVATSDEDDGADDDGID